MSDSARSVDRDLRLVPAPGFVPAVGWGIAAMADARRRTLASVAKLGAHALDRPTRPAGNTVGSLLYHLAGVEMDWLYTDLLQVPQPDAVRTLLPWPLDDEQGHLTPVVASMADHLDRLEAVRRHFLEVFAGYDEEDYLRARTLEDYRVTPAWVCFHLVQHEAHHRSQMTALLSRP